MEHLTSKQLHVHASHLLRSSVGTDLSRPHLPCAPCWADCWQYDGFPFGGCWSQAQSPTWIPKGKLINHLDFGQRVLKPCKIKCPFFLRKRFNNICLLILLGIKRTILFHALHQSEDKGCHILFQIPTHYNSPTNMRGGMKISVLARDKFYHEIYFASYFIRNVCKFVSSLK